MALDVDTISERHSDDEHEDSDTTHEEAIGEAERVESQLASLQAEHAKVQDECSILRAQVEALTAELAVAKEEAGNAKIEKATEEDTVTHLRQTVEESRRAIMRLQEENAATLKRLTEARRESVNSVTAPSGTRSKRQSLIFPPPAEASRENRRHSFNPAQAQTYSFANLVDIFGSDKVPPSPKRPSSVAGPTTSKANKRKSLTIVNKVLGPDSDDETCTIEERRTKLSSLSINVEDGRRHSKTPLPSPHTINEDLPDTSELLQLKEELMDVRKQLVDAEEAKSASDQAVQALKEFICQITSTDGEGFQGVSLPPMPSASGDSLDEPESKPKSRWGMPRMSNIMGSVKKEAKVADSKEAPPRMMGSPSLSAFTGWGLRRTPSSSAQSDITVASSMAADASSQGTPRSADISPTNSTALGLLSPVDNEELRNFPRPSLSMSVSSVSSESSPPMPTPPFISVADGILNNKIAHNPDKVSVTVTESQ